MAVLDVAVCTCRPYMALYRYRPHLAVYSCRPYIAVYTCRQCMAVCTCMYVAVYNMGYNIFKNCQ